MYCPECNHHKKNRYVSRTLYPKCELCGYKFIFLPGELKNNLNDKAFKNRIKLLSNEGKTFFTFKQLYYWTMRASASKFSFFSLLIFLPLIPGLIMLILSEHTALKLLGAGLILLSVLLIILNYIRHDKWKVPYSPEEFNKYILIPWEKGRGKLPGLLTQKTLTFNNPEYNDLMDYSFDYLIITGQNETANFLIKNDFHFKNKAAIVSYNQYPQHLFPYVLEQVAKNPSIPVFVIHDADIVFANLKNKVKKNWFPVVNARIYDLGLHPRHVIKYRKFITTKRQTITDNIDLSDYTAKEQIWFKDGYVADLDFIHPLKLITMLQYLISYFRENGDKDFIKETDKAFLLAIGVKAGSDKDLDEDMDFG